MCEKECWRSRKETVETVGPVNYSTTYDREGCREIQATKPVDPCRRRLWVGGSHSQG